MQIIIGPFHPHLEAALVQEIGRYKTTDPFCPLLILVPSDSMRRRLKVLLAGIHQLNLLNLHILTFHQLAGRLFEEQCGVSDPGLRGDAFLEEILRRLIRMDCQADSVFSGMDETEGGCAALWQTLRDLKEGLVDPEVAIAALEEGHFGGEGIEKISDLFGLYGKLRFRCKEWDIRDYTDLDTMAVAQVPSSRFLKQFRHIFHYGFYDLTQVQVELFQAVARHNPATLLFPLVKGHPGWIFAERFYDRYVQGLVTDASQVQNLIQGPQFSDHAVQSRLFIENLEGPPSAGFPCTIINCSGASDEVLTVAKEILRLVAEGGVAFNEIGVVARNLEPYVTPIKELFPKHGIAMSGTAKESVVKFPLAKAVLLLTSLATKGYGRSQVIDLTASPYFNARPFCPEGSWPRPDLWDVLTRRIGITKGLEEWRRLERYLNRGIVQSGQGNEDEDSKGPSIPSEQVQCLWQVFTHLYQDLNGFPVEASWSDYVARWRALLDKYLGLTNLEQKTSMRSQEDHVIQTVMNTLEELSGLEVIAPRIPLTHFTQTFHRWLERATIPMVDPNRSGVVVMDAMSARGVSFRVLFILGLSEGAFPRTIREDAFLRDGARRVLETVLGYKVGEKLAGYDEEKLLFTLLVGAARERLYCLYQRSDETGRPLAPSWYLGELRRAVWDEKATLTSKEGEADPGLERAIPRGILEKGSVAPFDQTGLLLPRELAVRLSLESQDPTPLLEHCCLSPELYERGRHALTFIESRGPLTAYDGMIGSLLECWEAIRRKGVAPTSLERYARCPFQFFSFHVLGLEPIERPEEMSGLEPLEQGQLCHAILKEFYQELVDKAYFTGGAPRADVHAILKEASHRVFSNYELENPVGYPVAWEIVKERLMGMLTQVAVQDLQALSESGYRPLAFEVKCEGHLEGRWPAALKGFPIRGRLDRIDHHPAQGRYRVIDYKYKSGRSQGTEDRNLFQSAIRGQRLQPPFYLLLAEQYVSRRENGDVDVSIEAAFYFLAPNWPGGPFVVSLFLGDNWKGEAGERLKGTISLLIEGIREGRFFIVPGPYCNHCDVKTICRKQHPFSQWRAEQDPVVQPYRDLRQQTASKGKASEDEGPKPPRRKMP